MIFRMGLVALAAAAAFVAPHAEAQQVIQYGEVARVAIQWQEIIADEAGLFAKHGVKLDRALVGASPKVIQGLAGGHLPARTRPWRAAGSVRRHSKH